MARASGSFAHGLQSLPQSSKIFSAPTCNGVPWFLKITEMFFLLLPSLKLSHCQGQTGFSPNAFSLVLWPDP